MRSLKQLIEFRFEKEIRARMTLDRAEGTCEPFPGGCNDELADALRSRGIEGLYSHQVEAFGAITGSRDTLLISRTASGKTLSFFLPIFNEYMNSDVPFSVLLLYPTKALSRDQEGAFGALMKAAKQGCSLGTFDGDTPRDERERIQKSADFVITNPDMLHSGILPNHNRRWKSFLSRLRYIVVDEVHIYRGSFGSHASNVFRRLIRVCAIHGSSPVFVCSSATVGNPVEHVRSLFHRDFTVIDRDGAPRPGRDLYFINPPMVRSHGDALYRKGPASVSIPLIRESVKRGIRTICFCRARQEVERLYRAVVDGHPELSSRVKPYRGGLLPDERRQLERDLSAGAITAIITTNALELGIDIGDLELCILSGHPGTVASFWQQAGRVGRRGNSSVVIYIARESPIDQYLINHPEFILSAPVEQALLNADNPYILLQHLPCAAVEHPLRHKEELFDNNIYSGALSILREENTVVPWNDTFRYALQDYPSRGVNLRGMTDYNVDIYCGTEVIGEIDPIGARGTLYRDAIYQHLGMKYMSMDLDLEKKLCRVEPVEVDYFTEAVWEGRVELVDSEDRKDMRGARLEFGCININKQPKLYKKIRERSYENIGYGPITLPAFEYDTTGFNFLPPEAWTGAMEGVDKRYTDSALYGLAYVLRHTAPMLCMCDARDMGTDVSLVDTGQEKWRSALYLFDTVEGGVGYAERIYEKIEASLELCRKVIEECDCDAGCPSCVPPLPPGVENGELEAFMTESDATSKCTLSLLRALLEGSVVVPEIRIRRIPVTPAVDPVTPDEEQARINRKLNRAADILKRKRDRLH